MFAEQFNKILEKKKTNISKVSKETNIPATTMYDWAKGNTEPTIKHLKVLSEYFKVSPKYFLN